MGGVRRILRMFRPTGVLASIVVAAVLLAAGGQDALAALSSAAKALQLKKPDAAANASAAKGDAQKSAASPAERLAQIEREIGDEQAGQRPVPARATPAQILEIGALLRRTAALLQGQIDVQAEIVSARTAREEAERASAAWQGFDQPGPHSIAQLDALFDDLDSERTRLHSFESVGKLNISELERLELSYKELQSEERLALERATAEPAALEVAQLRTRRAGEIVELLRLQAELNRELAQTARVRAALLERQIDAVRANLSFTAADLQREVVAIQAHVASLDRRAEAAVSARAAATAEKERARQLVDALPAPDSDDERSRRALAETRLHAANVTLDALRAQYSALSAMRSITPAAIELWNQRFAAVNDADPDKRSAAVNALQEVLSRVHVLQSYADDLVLLVETSLQEQQRLLARLAPDAPGRRYEAAALDSVRGAREVASEMQLMARKVRSASDHWVRELRQREAQRPAGEQLADAWSRTKEAARSVWDFELFAVEDTIVIGGRPSTVERAVTIGKSIGALLIFVVGYAIAGALTRRARRVMVAKMGMSVGQAKVAGRWIMIVVGVVLLILTLNLARIPLTVFAFLGGALAIGVGFGMQTLLKNLISGIMVLLERKVRVGDVVEVGGVQGVVTAVDVRSTTVRQSDGIETMIPNALLLEEQVTNWTGESPMVRRVVKIGVPYGSPVRQVADILGAAATEHGQVLKDPAPQVIFAEFGDSALLFSLYFWLDISKHSGMQVSSDLRFMLDKRLAEAGIAITSPREVRVTGLPPLRVDGAGAAPAGVPASQPAAGPA